MWRIEAATTMNLSFVMVKIFLPDCDAPAVHPFLTEGLLTANLTVFF
jgi:hypothetical protein